MLKSSMQKGVLFLTARCYQKCNKKFTNTNLAFRVEYSPSQTIKIDTSQASNSFLYENQCKFVIDKASKLNEIVHSHTTKLSLHWFYKLRDGTPRLYKIYKKQNIISLGTVHKQLTYFHWYTNAPEKRISYVFYIMYSRFCISFKI